MLAMKVLQSPVVISPAAASYQHKQPRVVNASAALALLACLSNTRKLRRRQQVGRCLRMHNVRHPAAHRWKARGRVEAAVSQAQENDPKRGVRGSLRAGPGPGSVKQRDGVFVDDDLVDEAGPVPFLEMLRLKAQAAVEFVDEYASWNVVSSVVVFAVFALETYNIEEADRMMAGMMGGMMSIGPQDLRDVEFVINNLFFGEYILRAWINRFDRKYILSPLALVDAASILPPFLSALSASPVLVRSLRLLRVLRLLRLLDRNSNSVFFGVIKSDSITVQLIGLVVELLCILLLVAGIIYDLETDFNPDVKNLGDTMWWAFCTFTGIGQPFSIVTGWGKLATVVTVVVALGIIPGQLAKLGKTVGTAIMADMLPQVAPASPFNTASDEKDVSCTTCGLERHDSDARFCKRCGTSLPLDSQSSTTNTTSAVAGKKRELDGSRR
eukprot:jgi/Chlat1/7670/Chrsp64S07127